VAQEMQLRQLRVLYERKLEYNNKFCVCYVDYEKAFDRVD